MSIRAVLFVASVLLAGCRWSGDDANPSVPPPPPPPPAAVAPSITTQPAAVSVTAGQTATFSVVASGTAPLTYQWRRDGVDIAGATGASYTAPATALGDDGAAYTVVVTNGTGSVTTTAAVLTVTLPAGTTSRIALSQTTALLTGAGETVKLDAHPVDAQGAPLAGVVTWSSSNLACITVDATGRVTARAIGSALLFADANGVKSPPVFIVVAEPVPGALLVADSQVLAIGAMDASQRYDVTVSGVANAPAPGTAVLGTGVAKVAGQVVSTRPEAGNLVLTLQLAPLPGLLARYDIDFDVDLSTLGVSKLSVHEPVMLKNSRETRLQAAGFEPFHCDGEIKVGLVTPSITLTPQLASRMIIKTSKDDPALPPDYAKMALAGSFALKGKAGIELSAEFGGSVTCVATLPPIEIPINGPLALILSPALRLGVGFELEAKLVAVTAELSATGTMGMEHTLGFECKAGACHPLEDFKLIDDFKFVGKLPTVNDMRADLSGQVFVLAGIDAVAFLGLVDAHIIEATVGPKQSFELAFPDDQAKSPGSASNYHLDLDGVIKPGASLSDAIEKFIDDDSVSLSFKVPFSSKLAESPKGAFTATPDNVGYGKPVTLKVVLDTPLTYPLVGEDGETAYNVAHVNIYRKKQEDAEFTPWKELTASQDQTTFVTEWTPTAAETGDYEFAAFTDTLMPVTDLEVADDSRRHVHVRGAGWSGIVTFTMQGREVETRNDSNPDGQSTTTTTYEDSASGRLELEPMANAQGMGFMTVAQSSGTYSSSQLSQTDAEYRRGDCTVVETSTGEDFLTGPMRAPDGSFAQLTMTGPDTYDLTVPYLTGRISGTHHVSGSATQTGGPTCHDSPPSDTTTQTEGSASTSILMVHGTLEKGAARGTAKVAVPGTPDKEYTLEWNLTP